MIDSAKKQAEYYRRKYGKKSADRVTAIKESYNARGLKTVHLDKVLSHLSKE